jgi:hypothetical protein
VSAPAVLVADLCQDSAQIMAGWVHSSSHDVSHLIFQDNGLSAFMPKSLGNQKSNEKKPEPKRAVAPADDEYEVEELGVDPMMAMMPMSFGKQDKKRDLTARFEKTKRVVNAISGNSDLQQQPEVTSAQNQENEDDDENDDDDSDDMIGPMPAEVEVQDEDEEGEDEDEFPISHEIVLKDHTKVFHYSHTTFAYL